MTEPEELAYVYVTKYWQTRGILEVQIERITAKGTLYYFAPEGLNGKRSVPRDSWELTLEDARKAVMKKARHRLRSLRLQMDKIDQVVRLEATMVRLERGKP